jgi:hypothetical protein
MGGTMNLVPQEAWEKAVIPPWKLRLLRLAFPRRQAVILRGKTYLIR